jgi:hypothetical protein
MCPNPLATLPLEPCALKYLFTSVLGECHLEARLSISRTNGSWDSILSDASRCLIAYSQTLYAESTGSLHNFRGAGSGYDDATSRFNAMAQCFSGTAESPSRWTTALNHLIRPRRCSASLRVMCSNLRHELI